MEEAPADSRFQSGDAVFGLIAGGGYAEYAVLDEALAVPKPDWLSWVEAASLPEALDDSVVQSGECRQAGTGRNAANARRSQWGGGGLHPVSQFPRRPGHCQCR
ncbi:hypothetical protein [Paludibacterium denitrificans]|uniref:hypothetical protein n=1 Tax=Paludibacterium denitrificans TaxID=2675226 RepID=UPI001E2EFA95|nr:hypothetical protein [Paludibacterium denitrificans]